MSPNRSSKRSNSFSVCLIRIHLILFMWSWLTIPITEFVFARPINAQNGNTTKELKYDNIYSANLAKDTEDPNPSEIQKVVCTVIAGDVTASAEAVTTKSLKGVWGSGQMSTAFSDLENKLTKELRIIKNLLISLSQERPIPQGSKSSHNNSEIAKECKQATTFASAPTKVAEPSLTLPMREKDIFISNNTVMFQKNRKIFNYYWKIENFTKKIENGSAITVESPVFSIKGRTFKIKASFQHLHRDFLFLQLEDASLTVPTRNSIILETGGIFKEIRNNSFKHKISVLHQNVQRTGDLVSQEYDNLETGFLIPNSALLDSPFVKNDSLLIQICLHM